MWTFAHQKHPKGLLYYKRPNTWTFPDGTDEWAKALAISKWEDSFSSWEQKTCVHFVQEPVGRANVGALDIEWTGAPSYNVVRKKIYLGMSTHEKVIKHEIGHW